jgi:hypothetical protein
VAPTQEDQPLLSSKRRPHFQTHRWSWNEQQFGHESRRDPKPRITGLARAGSNLLLCYAIHLDLSCPRLGLSTISYITNLQRFQNKYLKILSKVPWMTAMKSFCRDLRMDTVLEFVKTRGHADLPGASGLDTTTNGTI